MHYYFGHRGIMAACDALEINASSALTTYALELPRRTDYALQRTSWSLISPCLIRTQGETQHGRTPFCSLQLQPCPVEANS